MTSISRWSESRVLDYFAMMRRGPQELHAELLTQLAGVALERPAGWDQEAQRIVPRMDYSDGCFVCMTRARRLYWHHVIWVSHGGSNAASNLVRLCHTCHRGQHPWLPPSTTWECRGFTWIGDMIGRALERLEERWESRRDGVRTGEHEWPQF